MTGLYRFTGETNGIRGFMNDLSDSVGAMLRENKQWDVHLDCLDVEGNQGYILLWDYKRQHRGEVWVTYGLGQNWRENDGFLYVKQMEQIKPGQISTGGLSSSAAELRAAAQFYDDLAALLTQKYGASISQEYGGTTYKAKIPERRAEELEERVTV